HQQTTLTSRRGYGICHLSDDFRGHGVIRNPPVQRRNARSDEHVLGLCFVCRITKIEFSRQPDREIALAYQYLGYRWYLLSLRCLRPVVLCNARERIKE